jgi:phage baseplate assembly protein W
MSLRITNLAGISLVDQPPAQVQIVASTNAGGPVALQCLIIEDSALPEHYLSGTLNWNNGALPVVYSGTGAGTLTNSYVTGGTLAGTGSAGTLVLDVFRNLPPGAYVLQLAAHNFVPPVWETASVNFSVEVQPARPANTATPLLYGPILPADSGFPNATQWNWNSGSDAAVLASSVKMLLLTTVGERIMLPEYGTRLRYLLFEANQSGIDNLVQQEIASALARWEPRVAVQSLQVSKSGERDITVLATFVSKLSQRTFTIPTVFTQ